MASSASKTSPTSNASAGGSSTSSSTAHYLRPHAKEDVVAYLLTEAWRLRERYGAAVAQSFRLRPASGACPGDTFASLTELGRGRMVAREVADCTRRSAKKRRRGR